jgi:multidrug efflux pump subunit AcrB
MAILIVLVGVVTITRMSTGIFPNISIPVVSVMREGIQVEVKSTEQSKPPSTVAQSSSTR